MLSRKKLRPGSRRNSREVCAIADWAQEKQYSVTFMCDQLGVTRRATTGGARRGRVRGSTPTPSSSRRSSGIHTDLDGNLGVRRVWAELVHPRDPHCPEAGLAADARCWSVRTPPASPAQDHHRRAATCGCAGYSRTGLHRYCTGHSVVRGHHVGADPSMAGFTPRP